MTAPITVSTPRQRLDNGQQRIEATISLPDRSYDIFMRATRGPLADNADPFLAVALLPAMCLNAPIVVEGAVSPLLLQHIDTIQDIFARWFERLHKTSVRVAGRRRVTVGAQRGVASFYSGGVDSSYTLLKHREEVTTLVFVHGFDLPLAKTELRESIAGALRGAANGFGKTMIEVETNLRDLLDVYVDWNRQACGLSLGAVAQALAPQFSRMYWGSTEPYESLHALGTHPLLDPLWGTEDLEIVHDGCEHSRWEKAQAIIDNPVVQRYLRVCWHHEHGRYNCGLCGGCLRAMAFLRATGMAERFPTFPPLDPDLIRNMPVDRGFIMPQLEEILSIAERAGRDPDLILALRDCLARPEVTARVSDPMARAQRERTRVIALEIQLAQLTSSLSWRVTAPLRACSRAARRLRKGSKR